jgi:transcriptional regulator with XRE-family HTH domain
MHQTLDQVTTAFDDWRATRSKRGRIPNTLITQALGLLDRYSKADIARRLGINHAMLSRWLEKQTTDDTFIVLPTAAAKPVISTITKPLEVSIRFPSGIQLTLVGAESEAAAFVSELQQRGTL